MPGSTKNQAPKSQEPSEQAAVSSCPPNIGELFQTWVNHDPDNRAKAFIKIYGDNSVIVSSGESIIHRSHFVADAQDWFNAVIASEGATSGTEPISD